MAIINVVVALFAIVRTDNTLYDYEGAYDSGKCMPFSYWCL